MSSGVHGAALTDGTRDSKRDPKRAKNGACAPDFGGGFKSLDPKYKSTSNVP
jgi:hypothetical protein